MTESITETSPILSTNLSIRAIKTILLLNFLKNLTLFIRYEKTGPKPFLIYLPSALAEIAEKYIHFPISRPSQYAIQDLT